MRKIFVFFVSLVIIVFLKIYKRFKELNIEKRNKKEIELFYREYYRF